MPHRSGRLIARWLNSTVTPLDRPSSIASLTASRSSPNARECVAYRAPCSARTSARASTSSKSPYTLGTWVRPVLMPNAPCSSVVAEIVDHPRELRRFGRSGLDAHRRHAEGAMSGERCDVERDAGVFQRSGVTVEVGPPRTDRGRWHAARWSACRSRRDGSIGKAENEQLPTTSVVTPCRSLLSPSPSTSKVRSECVWMSMKPGHSTAPRTSTSRCASNGSRPPSVSAAPIEAMRPSATATCPREPEPRSRR